MRNGVRSALVISLVLHLLLLWPVREANPDAEPPRVLTASLRAAAADAMPSQPPQQQPKPPQTQSPHRTSASASRQSATAQRKSADVPSARLRESDAPARRPASALPAEDAFPLTAEAAPGSADSLVPASAAVASADSLAVRAPPSVSPPAAAHAARVAGEREYRLGLAVQARRFKRYPPRAMADGIGGTAEVRVAMAAAAPAADVQLLRSSGDASLDAAALEMFTRAAARTALPESLRGHDFAVSLPIVFDPQAD